MSAEATAMVREDGPFPTDAEHDEPKVGRVIEVSPGQYAATKGVNYETSPQVDKLFTALARAQHKMKGASKDSLNPTFKSKYADLANVIEAVRDPLGQNGLCVIQLPYVNGSEVTVTTIVGHESGQWIKGSMTLRSVRQIYGGGFEERDDPQGIGSCTTYCRRYLQSAMLNVAAEDDDGNAASGQGRVAGRSAQTVDRTVFSHFSALQQALQSIGMGETYDKFLEENGLSFDKDGQPNLERSDAAQIYNRLKALVQQVVSERKEEVVVAKKAKETQTSTVTVPTQPKQETKAEAPTPPPEVRQEVTGNGGVTLKFGINQPPPPVAPSVPKPVVEPPKPEPPKTQEEPAQQKPLDKATAMKQRMQGVVNLLVNRGVSPVKASTIQAEFFRGFFRVKSLKTMTDPAMYEAPMNSLENILNGNDEDAINAIIIDARKQGNLASGGRAEDVADQFFSENKWTPKMVTTGRKLQRTLGHAPDELITYLKAINMVRPSESDLMAFCRLVAVEEADGPYRGAYHLIEVADMVEKENGNRPAYEDILQGLEGALGKKLEEASHKEIEEAFKTALSSKQQPPAEEEENLPLFR